MAPVVWPSLMARIAAGHDPDGIAKVESTRLPLENIEIRLHAIADQSKTVAV